MSEIKFLIDNNFAFLGLNPDGKESDFA